VPPNVLTGASPITAIIVFTASSLVVRAIVIKVSVEGSGTNHRPPNTERVVTSEVR
jgi:hypothetical protein